MGEEAEGNPACSSVEGHELGSRLLSAGACLGWQVLWIRKYFILSYVMQQHVQT